MFIFFRNNFRLICLSLNFLLWIWHPWSVEENSINHSLRLNVCFHNCASFWFKQVWFGNSNATSTPHTHSEALNKCRLTHFWIHLVTRLKLATFLGEWKSNKYHFSKKHRIEQYSQRILYLRIWRKVKKGDAIVDLKTTVENYYMGKTKWNGI